MIVLTLMWCLAGKPVCGAEIIAPPDPAFGLFACLAGAEASAVIYQTQHPGRIVRRWSCGPAHENT